MLRPTAITRLRWLVPIVAACLVASGCEPAPPTAPPTLAPPTLASPAPSDLPQPTRPPASPIAEIPFADAVQDAIDIDAIMADLQQLQAITDDHGGARPAGSDGHSAAADFVAGQLRDAGYGVELQKVDLPVFTQTGPGTLEIKGVNPRAFDDIHDFKAMLFSPSAELTAPLYALGYNPQAGAADADGLGCSPEDWLSVPAGVVALVQPGNCRRRDAVVQAQVAGAVGIITAYPAWRRDGVLRPTLIEPSDIRIPALGVTGEVGNALNDAAASGASVHISVRTSTVSGSSVNVIGETPWGDPDHVVMLGGHLDSAVDGPGINDDGSGTMTVLAIARALTSLAGTGKGPGTPPPAPAWKVRVALWTGEEIGLAGSLAWVGRSDAPPLRSIAAYVNLDMLGSRNGGRYVYDGAATTRPVESGVLNRLFTRALEADGLTWQPIAVGSSDNVPFDQFGIATGGLFSGANEIKTTEQANLFGGTPNAPEDACFHLPCDRLDGIDRTLLRDLARAAAWGVGALASGEVQLSGE